MTDSMFLGNALNAVDAKNRLSIPAAFREVIAARSGQRALVLTLHERDNCLVGYDPTHPATVTNEIATRFAGDYSGVRDNHARAALGSMETVPIDDNGRIILSANLKDMGEIGRLALFVGVGMAFEVWNPQLFLDLPGLDPRLARSVRRLVDVRGVE